MNCDSDLTSNAQSSHEQSTNLQAQSDVERTSTNINKLGNTTPEAVHKPEDFSHNYKNNENKEDTISTEEGAGIKEEIGVEKEEEEEEEVAKEEDLLLYCVFCLLGIGYLMPYHCYLLSLDYFIDVYPDGEMAFLFGVCYMIPASLLLLFLVRFSYLIPLPVKVYGGFSVFILLLVSVPFVAFVIPGTTLAYYFTIVSIIFIGLSDAMCQGGIAGLAGQLPTIYPQAIMLGNGIAGVIAALARIISKVALSNNEESLRDSMAVFFLSACVLMVICMLTFGFLMRNPIVLFYTRTQPASQKATIESEASSSAEASNEENTAPKPITKSTHKSYQTLPIEHNEDEDNAYNSKAEQKVGCFAKFLNDNKHYWQVLKTVWLEAALVVLSFAITLSLFPGLLNEVPSTFKLGHWMPVWIVGIFNLGDLVGRFLPRLKVARVSMFWLITISLCRLSFFILFILFVEPKLFSGDVYLFVLIFLFATSGGFTGTLAFTYGPQRVNTPEEKDIVGTVMACSILVGLGLGSIISTLVLLYIKLAS